MHYPNYARTPASPPEPLPPSPPMRFKWRCKHNHLFTNDARLCEKRRFLKLDPCDICTDHLVRVRYVKNG